MTDAGVGRLLVVSLHQGIADLLPTRLEFYEAWLNPVALREGRMGLAPINAALSFLRREGEPYQPITARAGEYAAEWTVESLPALTRSVLGGVPKRIRARLVIRLARGLIQETYGGSGAKVRWRRGRAAINISGSVFCGVRGQVDQPMCEFYASAIRRLLTLFGLDAEVGTSRCRATGAGECLMTVIVRREGAGVGS